MKSIELLKGYIGSLSYHSAECREYIDELGKLIDLEEVVDWGEVLRLVDMLVDTVAKTTDLEEICGDDGESMSWDEAMDIYQRIRLRAGDDQPEGFPAEVSDGL